MSGGQNCIGTLCGFSLNNRRGGVKGLGLEVWLFYHLEHKAGDLPTNLVHVHLDGGQSGLDDHGKGIVVKGHQRNVGREAGVRFKNEGN